MYSIRYNIGGVEFSLDDIEHGVLRGSPEGDARSFKKGDPRFGESRSSETSRSNRETGTHETKGDARFSKH
jgi:hypothetical protein